MTYNYTSKNFCKNKNLKTIIRTKKRGGKENVEIYIFS